MTFISAGTGRNKAVTPPPPWRPVRADLRKPAETAILPLPSLLSVHKEGHAFMDATGSRRRSGTISVVLLLLLRAGGGLAWSSKGTQRERAAMYIKRCSTGGTIEVKSNR